MKGLKEFVKTKKLNEDTTINYKKVEEADVPTSKRELYSKAKIGFNGLKKRLDDILSLVEKGEYKFVSSFLDDVATSCQRMAKAYDDADRMDRAGKMTESVKAKKLNEAWMPDSETIAWLKDYLRDVKRGEGWVDIDKVVYDADIELNKDFSKNTKELAEYIKRIGGGSILKEASNIKMYRKIDDTYVIIEPDGSYTFWKDHGKTKGAQNRSLHGQPGAVKELGALGYKVANTLNEAFEVVDSGNGKKYYSSDEESDATTWAKDNVNKLHRPLKVVSGYKMYKSFEPRTIVKEATSNLREGFGELEVYTSFGPGFGVQIYPSRTGELTAHVGYVSNGSGNGSYKKELKTETELKAIDEIKIADLKGIERVLKKHLDALDSDLQKILKQYGYK